MQCEEALRESIRTNLAAFEVDTKQAEKSAAVAMIVVEEGFGAALQDLPKHEDWRSTPALLLTRRSLKLRNHPGQWALPGGRIDAGETPVMTAMREAKEEVDLSLGEADFLGRLDDYVTRSGFLITPLVFWGGKALQMQRNPDEVESIHRIPVQELLREDAPMLDYDEIEETDDDRPVLRMPIGDNWIAAPTAALLYQFREVCILGRHTKVAHFDQPRFAWR